MGNCVYCSKPAGFLRKKHKECVRIFEAGKSQILTSFNDAVSGSDSVDELNNKLKAIAGTHFIDDALYKQLLIEGWGKAVLASLDDGILTKDEESKLTSLQQKLSLTQGDLDQKGAYTKLVQAAVLRDLVEGKLPDRVVVQGNLPFNFQKNEKIVWLFKGVNYFEQKTRRQYVGGYSGVSIRIAKGVYYRVGGFKGHPIERTENVHVDTGMLCVTDKHIYFSGASKSFRIPFTKIVTMTPHSDGVTVHRDAASAKPQSFALGDGWFIYNLLANVAKLAD